MKISTSEVALNTWALVIGVSSYDSGDLHSLPGAMIQAEELRRALEDVSGPGVPSNQIQALCGDRVTAFEMLKALERACEGCGPTGTLFVYFAGHGLRQDDQFYLCASDTSTGDLRQSALSSAELNRVLASARARGVFVVLDCCMGASLAECAREAFTQLGSSEFRILLSASRADQPSYEIPEAKGTLFSKHLVRILRGIEIAGREPGCVFFTELFDHLQDRIHEDHDLYHPDTPRQEPVASALYSRDPLLFVHGGLARKPMVVETLRYTKDTLRKIAIRTTTAVAALLFLGFGGTWTFLEHSQFALAEGQDLAIYHGVPGVRLLGFPERVWTLSLPAAAASQGSALSQGLPVQAPMNKPVIPILMEQLRPEYRALVFLWNEDRPAAHRELRRMLAAGRGETPYSLEQALSMFSGLAGKEDVEILRRYLMSPRPGQRIPAAAALFHFDPQHALRVLSGWQDLDSHRGLPALLKGRCSPEVQTYLASLLNDADFGVMQPEVFDAALRLGCRLSAEDLFAAHENTYYLTDVQDLAHTAEVMGEGEPLRLLLERAALSGTDDWADVTHALLLLAEMPSGKCSEELLRLADHPEVYVQDALGNLVARKCPGQAGRLPKTAGVVTALVGRKALPAGAALEGLIHADQSHEIVGFLKALAEHGDPRALSRIAQYVRHPETVVRQEAVLALQSLGAKPSYPVLLTDPANNVQEAAFSWFAAAKPRETLSQLANRLGEEFLDYAPRVVSRLAASSVDLDLFRQKLRASTRERRRAAEILAMRADPEEVLSLLVNEDASLRQAVADYVGANPRLEEIGASLPEAIEFPDLAPGQVRAALEQRTALGGEVQAMPRWAQAWRRDLIGRSRNLAPGLQLWLAGQDRQLQ